MTSDDDEILGSEPTEAATTEGCDATSMQCPACGAPLTYAPDKDLFVCDYCNSEYTRAQLDQDAEERALETARRLAESEEYSAHMRTYSCPSCGAEIMADETTAAQFCAYCGNPVILKGRVSGEAKPDKIIPFKITKEQAQQEVHRFLAKKKFVPKPFLSTSILEKMMGVYHPFWMTDADTDCAMDAEATTVTVWISSNKRYTRTKFFNIYRRGDIHFEDIATNALRDTDKVLVEGVLPFPVEAHRDFDMAYMSGFYAKRNDLTREDVRDEVTRRMREYAAALLKQTVVGYDSVKVQRQAVIVNKSNWDYTLLPIWLLHYTYRGKIYTFAVNGYTGKIFGDLPISGFKLAWLFGGIAAGLGAILGLLGGLLL